MFKIVDKNIHYIIPPHGVTVTLHVPSKCRNNCSFCIINHKYYNDNIKPDKDAIMAAAENLRYADFVGSFVISGGEPLDNMNFTVDIVDMLCRHGIVEKRKPIYINTQMPIDKLFGFNSKINDIRHYISGISVSRHAARNEDEHFNLESTSDYYVKMYAENLPIRINCVLNDKTDIAGVVNRWKDVSVTVSFRRNYCDTTEVDLYEIDKETKQKFGEAGIIGDVDVKTDNVHCYKALILKEPTKAIFQYYACLENTCIKHRFVDDVEVYELHDLVVLPDGRIFDDWDIQKAHEIIF